LVNVSSDKPQTIPVSDLNIQGIVYNISGGFVISVIITPLGFLVKGS